MLAFDMYRQGLVSGRPATDSAHDQLRDMCPQIAWRITVSCQQMTKSAGLMGNHIRALQNTHCSTGLWHQPSLYMLLESSI